MYAINNIWLYYFLLFEFVVMLIVRGFLNDKYIVRSKLINKHIQI
jgi:hypothetical protein